MLIIFIGILIASLGGFIGFRRLSFLTVVIVASFATWLTYSAFGIPLANAIYQLGVKAENAYSISIGLIVIVVFMLGLYFGIKILAFLGLSDFGTEYEYASASSGIIDTVFGAGFAGIVFIIIVALFSGR